MSAGTFTDMLGRTGRTGDREIVPVCGDDGMPQLAIAEVIDVVVREPNPFAAELSVRTRVGNDESCMYEPDEVVLLADAGQATGGAAGSTRTRQVITGRASYLGRDAVNCGQLLDYSSFESVRP